MEKNIRMMERSLKPVSLASQVFDRLENDILGGKYPKGTVLTELQLCTDLGVSRTPVREALKRLEQEHIIEGTDRGMVVVSITPEDVQAIYAIRENIEWMAAVACAENATDEQIADLKNVIDLQEYYTERGDAERVRQLDNEFHAMIYRYSGSSVYYDTLTPLHKKIQKVRKASFENPERAMAASKEHKVLYDAIARHDTEAAKAAMTQHIHNARAHMRTLVQNDENA